MRLSDKAIDIIDQDIKKNGIPKDSYFKNPHNSEDMTITTELAQLREELLNPAIGSNHHLRKLSLSLLDALEAKDKQIAVLESEIKSANERYENRTPTQWAYDQACSAIEKHRLRAESAENRIAELEARPEPQPVAYMHRSGQVVTREECCDDKTFAICCKVETPLYASAPAAQPVTVKLPEDRFFDYAREAIKQRDEQWIKKLAAAGITIAEGE